MAELTRAAYSEKDEQIKNLRAFQKKHEKETPAALAKLKKRPGREIIFLAR